MKQTQKTITITLEEPNEPKYFNPKTRDIRAMGRKVGEIIGQLNEERRDGTWDLTVYFGGRRVILETYETEDAVIEAMKAFTISTG